MHAEVSFGKTSAAPNLFCLFVQSCKNRVQVLLISENWRRKDGTRFYQPMKTVVLEKLYIDPESTVRFQCDGNLAVDRPERSGSLDTWPSEDSCGEDQQRDHCSTSSRSMSASLKPDA